MRYLSFMTAIVTAVVMACHWLMATAHNFTGTHGDAFSTRLQFCAWIVQLLVLNTYMVVSSQFLCPSTQSLEQLQVGECKKALKTAIELENPNEKTGKESKRLTLFDEVSSRLSRCPYRTPKATLLNRMIPRIP